MLWHELKQVKKDTNVGGTNGVLNKNQISYLPFEGVRPLPDASSGYGQGTQWGVIQRHQGKGSPLGLPSLGTRVRMSKQGCPGFLSWPSRLCSSVSEAAIFLMFCGEA